MNVLIHGDTVTSAALRHEVPLAIIDPFLYLEAGGRRAVVTHPLESDRIARVAPDLELLLADDLGADELIAEGRSWAEVDLELGVRAAAALGIREASVPPEFPVALADRLRRAGVGVTPDEAVFARRRRRKTATEMAGIRRAAAAAVAAMGAAAALLREAEIVGDGLVYDGEPLSAETVRTRIREVCARAGAPAPPDIMINAVGTDPPVGHDPGSGPLPPHVPIEIDLWPRDEESSCWADMTRTFVRGEITDPIARLHALVLEAHESACAAVRPGVTGVELYGLACDVFEAAGHPTQRTKAPGETLRAGFYFSLGHGVGLQVHEDPSLGRTGTDMLIAGDVIAVEPGTIRPGVGGTRVEDLLVVTEDGSERLTGEFAHGLVP
ncbi:MAG: Xaa-Pro aminopeptidase [Solirubrobacteraceae bacterium]|nr:Xaa-Pro aminopeptidase [Solirubrobacteraceae bacterium]